MEISHVAVLDRLLEPLTQSLTPDAARAIAGFRADSDTQAHIDELADKCSEGRLAPDEREEYQAYVEAIDTIAIIQAKARAVLSRHGEPT